MDGLPANVTMVKLLGCELDFTRSLKTWFCSSSNRKIYIIFDACHMLKLVRNLFSAYHTIFSSSGAIKWSHISQLDGIQQEAGLRAANKLTKQHINFKNQKMKVKLAAQTLRLSSSVAAALKMMNQCKMAGFEDVAPTVEFIETIDCLFDIFNSKNPNAPSFKGPLTLQNFALFEQRLLSLRNYLLQLKSPRGILIIQDKKYVFDNVLLQN